jgi:4-hydroxybenzoate polyprenyltransferase
MNVARLRTYASLVSFSHTVFALPFAASAVVLAHSRPHAPLTLWRVCAMLGCMFAARTSAMAFNRWADRDVDARNPRTRARHVPAGLVRPGEALGLALVSGGVFVASASTLGLWPALLSPLVLAVLLGYSFAKRFTFAAHAWLGVALALAPGGAWIAMGATVTPGVLLLMAAVVTWLVGFDVLYSLQDERFDREQGLRSIPARFGTRPALVISRLSHVCTVLALLSAGVVLGRGALYFVGVAVTGALLAYEQSLVGPGRLERINKAFFDVNAWVSVGFFVFTLADELARQQVSS